ncbi:hypothetical protein ANTPLA_LOCUS9899 [Anthophora plagiata]
MSYIPTIESALICKREVEQSKSVFGLGIIWRKDGIYNEEEAQQTLTFFIRLKVESEYPRHAKCSTFKERLRCYILLLYLL